MRRESEPQDVAASLIEALANEGEQLEQGSFTLDPAKAREKLRAYQLGDAHEWILLAISAGYVATGGRGPVHVYGGARASVRFSGISVSSAQLEHCFAAVFGRERGLEGEALTRAQVLRQLGLAANAALALGAHVEIESIEPSGDCHVLRVSPDGTQVIEHERAHGSEVGIRVEVRGRGQRRANRELELVRERCQLANTAIFLDDERMSQGPTFNMPLQRVEIRLGDAVVGKAAFEQFGVAPAKALIINRGVLIETETLTECAPGFVAIVDVDLPVDLSQRQILRDETWEQLLAAIRAVHDALPRPRLPAGGLASEGDARPWFSAVKAIAVLVLSGALLSVILLKWPIMDEGRNPEQLRIGCERGDRYACATLVDQTRDHSELRELWRLGCEAGDAQLCMLHAQELQHSKPGESLALMFRACRDGSVEACQRALRMGPDPTTAAELEHAWCFHGGDQKRCEVWLARARSICEDPFKCVAYREYLAGTCKNARTGEFCLEAAWMAHLGYGGPARPDRAQELFEHGCESRRKLEAACEWRARPPVSEQSCAYGDAWACYALGFEAHLWRGDVEASVGHFQRACELGLEVGCGAVDFVRGGIDPLMAFPNFDR
jgi:hypothetical protein